ncbi:MAG: FtsX-like permease family protein [Candidatus Lokiarchaeota archaeon]|nr:FtsX-like permease family protein [Candidatus Lokiarchaeota archaeon]
MGVRKHANLANYAIGNVIKHRSKTVAIILALAMSTSLLCSIEFIRQGVAQDFSLSLDEGPDITVQKLVGGRQAPCPISWRDNLTAYSGVEDVLPRVWGYADVGSGKLMTIMGINPAQYEETPGAVGTDIIGEGSFLPQNDTHKLVVGQGILDLMQRSMASVSLGVGSQISLIAYDNSLIPFEIVGIFSSKSKIYSYDILMTDIQSAREVLGVANDSCTDIAVWTSPGYNTNSIALQMDNTFPEARILSKSAMRDMGLRAYSVRAGIVALLWAVLLLVVVLLAFTVSSSGSDEARREVGLLKALGFDTVDVLEIRMFENLILGLLGCSTGISFAIVYDYFLGAPLLSEFVLGWSTSLLLGGMPLMVSPSTIFTAYAVGIAPILVASVIPAWRNAITEPDIVLRGV